MTTNASRIKTRPKLKKSHDVVPIDSRFALRVKIKSLAAESRIIRREEVRTRSFRQFEALRFHRLGLRTIARCTQLALAFIRGKSYDQVEKVGSAYISLAEIDSIARMAKTYGAPGNGITHAEIRAWLNGNSQAKAA